MITRIILKHKINGDIIEITLNVDQQSRGFDEAHKQLNIVEDGYIKMGYEEVICYNTF